MSRDYTTSRPDYDAQINHYYDTYIAAGQVADECGKQEADYRHAKNKWRGESRHAALCLRLTLIQKWRAQDANRVQ